MASVSFNATSVQIQIDLRGLKSFFAVLQKGARIHTYAGIALVVIGGVGLLISRGPLRPAPSTPWLDSLDQKLRARCNVETSTLGHFASETLNTIASMRRKFVGNFCDPEYGWGKIYSIIVMGGAFLTSVGIAEYYCLSTIGQSLIHDLEVKTARSR
jgi:hypothetical protein